MGGCLIRACPPVLVGYTESAMMVSARRSIISWECLNCPCLSCWWLQVSKSMSLTCILGMFTLFFFFFWSWGVWDHMKPSKRGISVFCSTLGSPDINLLVFQTRLCPNVVHQHFASPEVPEGEILLAIVCFSTGGGGGDFYEILSLPFLTIFTLFFNPLLRRAVFRYQAEGNDPHISV